MPRSKGRTGRPWRRVRAQVLAASTTCWLCGHDQAGDVDHDPPLVELERLGLDPRDKRYLKPAHGVQGCPTCGIKCNQVKGARAAQPQAPTSRRW
ncbi:hypothetical protein ACNF49_14055 [Actinomadura sp. ATCC 39365]